MSNDVLVQLTPYPAAFIIEHAKRRAAAAGFIIGTRTSDEIIVVDFIPMTHENTDQPSTKLYREKMILRRNAKRRFNKQDVIGWYSAGHADENMSEEDYQRWCNAPSTAFHGHTSLHLHCEMPHSRQPTPEVVWTASIVREDPTDRKLVYSEHKVVLAPQSSVASEVMLNHIASLALYNGGHSYPRSKLLNIDEVAYVANLDNKSSTDAVNEEHRKLQAAVTAAEKIVTGGSGGAKEAHEMMTAVESFRAIREESLQRQRELTGRVDFNTQQFKDALMIKCAAVILRKEIGMIEMLSTVYGEEKERRPNAEGGEEGAAKDQQQQQQSVAQQKQ